MSFGGSNEPCAFVIVRVNNDQKKEDLLKYSARLCEIMNKLAGIPLKRTSVIHEKCSEWHSGARMFESKMF
jgi:hypothetical protein